MVLTETKKFDVLFINDSKEENFLIEMLIEEDNIPISPTFIEDGSLAETYFASMSETESYPEYIFLDIKMPLMDGFRFLDEVYNGLNGRRAKTKLFILTASRDEEDRLRAAEFDQVEGYLKKPFTAEMFDELISGQLV